MGSYGIGPARIAAAAIEQRSDDDGIVWPWSIAPFHVHIVLVSGRDAEQRSAAEAIYAECWRQGLEALLDDRDERPGVKFKDADLLGIPAADYGGQRPHPRGGRGDPNATRRRPVAHPEGSRGGHRPRPQSYPGWRVTPRAELAWSLTSC